jgi:hypothetical protein
MILSLALVLVALSILLLLLYVEGWQKASVHGVKDLSRQIRPVDLEAFRNLVNPEEEAFLRASLRSRQFRQIQRERMRAALGYVRDTSQNAVLLMHLGEAASLSTDPGIAQAGKRLIDSALKVRLNTLLYSALLYWRVIFPASRIGYGKIADSYQQLNALAEQVVRLQQPKQNEHLTDML